jgi:hypothetical protein
VHHLEEPVGREAMQPLNHPRGSPLLKIQGRGAHSLSRGDPQLDPVVGNDYTIVQYHAARRARRARQVCPPVVRTQAFRLCGLGAQSGQTRVMRHQTSEVFMEGRGGRSSMPEAAEHPKGMEVDGDEALGLGMGGIGATNVCP